MAATTVREQAQRQRAPRGVRRPRSQRRLTPQAARRGLYADRWVPGYYIALKRELDRMVRETARDAAIGMDSGSSLSGKIGWVMALEEVKRRWLVPLVAQGYDLAGAEVSAAAVAALPKTVDDYIEEAAMLMKQGARRRAVPRGYTPPEPEELAGENVFTSPVRVGKPARLTARRTAVSQSDSFLLHGKFTDIERWIETTSVAEIAKQKALLAEVWAAAEASRDPETGAAWTPKRVSKEILDVGLTKDKTRAAMLARTGTIWAMNEGAQQRYDAAGVAAMSWWTVSDDARCPWCARMHGRTVRTNSPFRKRGEPLPARFPLAGGGFRTRHLKMPFEIQHPPLHPNCRCTVIPIVTPQQAQEIVPLPREVPKPTRAGTPTL